MSQRLEKQKYDIDTLSRQAKDTPIAMIATRLGYPPDRDNKILSPFRPGDTVPSCTVGGRQNTIVDWANPNTHYDTIAFVRYILDCTYIDAIKYILNITEDVEIINKKIKNTHLNNFKQNQSKIKKENNNTTYNIAKSLVECGFSIFPCNLDKTPRTQHGYKDARADISHVTQSTYTDNTLIGLRTGSHNNNNQNIIVVDIDVKDESKNGIKSLNEIEDKFEELPKTATIKTRSGGYHLIYNAPTKTTLMSSASKIAPGIDIRSERGYIIYWGEDGSELKNISDAPMWLVNLVASGKSYNDPTIDGTIYFSDEHTTTLLDVDIDQKPIETPKVKPNMVPNIIYEYAKKNYEADGIPLDGIVAAMVVASGATISRMIRVYPKQRTNSYSQNLHLWGYVASPPGLKKSASMEKGILGATHIQHMYNTYNQREKEKFEKLTKDEQKNTKIANKQLIVNKSSLEKLHEIQSNNDAGVFIVKDELIDLIEKQQSNNDEEKSYYLSGWNTTISDTKEEISTISRGQVLAYNVMSIYGCLTTSVLRSLVRSEMQQIKGFMQRYQVAILLDTEFENFRDDYYDSEIEDGKIKELFEKLATLTNPDTPIILKFEKEATEELQKWNDETNIKYMKEYKNRIEAEHFSKYFSLVVKLAGIFYAIDNIDTITKQITPKVDAEHIVMAIRYTEYLRQHAIAIYDIDSYIGVDQDVDTRRGRLTLTPNDILNKIKEELYTYEKYHMESNELIVSKNQIVQKLFNTRTRRKHLVHIELAFDHLKEVGWIYPKIKKLKNNKISTTYIINPTLFKSDFETDNDNEKELEETPPPTQPSGEPTHEPNTPTSTHDHPTMDQDDKEHSDNTASTDNNTTTGIPIDISESISETRNSNNDERDNNTAQPSTDTAISDRGCSDAVRFAGNRMVNNPMDDFFEDFSKIECPPEEETEDTIDATNTIDNIDALVDGIDF